MYGGLEAGGTKFVCVVGSDPESIVDSARIEVGDPDETLAAALSFVRQAIERGLELRAIGVGSFGPLELRPGHPRFGSILATTKPGWSGVDVLGPLRELELPIGIDTDVNAAALGEGRWGVARGVASFIYLTVGTGIGGGAVVDGHLVHGLGHPEMGHIAVPRRRGDEFPGICPFHGDCLEGMASGPAIAARFGRRAETLDGADRADAVATAAYYLGAGMRSLVYAFAPARVVVGGGVGSMPGLVAAAGRELIEQLAGYPGLPEHAAPTFVVSAALGEMAGPAGTLVLAERAARSEGQVRVEG